MLLSYPALAAHSCQTRCRVSCPSHALSPTSHKKKRTLSVSPAPSLSLSLSLSVHLSVSLSLFLSQRGERESQLCLTLRERLRGQREMGTDMDLGDVKKNMVELGKDFSHFGLGLLSAPNHEGPVQDERGCSRRGTAHPAERVHSSQSGVASGSRRTGPRVPVEQAPRIQARDSAPATSCTGSAFSSVAT